MAPPSLARRAARLLRLLEIRPDLITWELEGEPVKAVAFPALVGPLYPGNLVWLNTTAVDLGLGTGGVHFVISRADGDRVDGPPAGGFVGREAGHLMKLRYTPLQLRVMGVEEEASPHRDAVARFPGLGGAPVLGTELLSQAGAAAVAARAAAPGLRIVLVLLDSAALPIAFSRLVARLRADSVLDATVTVGQAFGGDYESVNVYTGLIAARAAAAGDLMLVSQGPGQAGTGTEYGFSGLALAEAFHACDTLGGTGILAPRLSAADPRPRHRPVSHHTLTLLRCIRAPVLVPLPTMTEEPGAAEVREALAGRECPEVDPGAGYPLGGAAILEALAPYREVLTTMGRGPEEDPLFFRAAAAAGLFAARRAGSREREEVA